MDTPRWATAEEFDPERINLAQTPDGKPAFWGAIVTRGPLDSNLPEEMVALGEPRHGDEGLATAMVLEPGAYRANLTDVSWSWRREGQQIVLLLHGMEQARLDEPGP